MDEYHRPFIHFVREMSPYFAELYADAPSDASLRDLPVVDHASYWAASNKDCRLVMTGPQIDGVIMKTGGTTSRPKTTGYSQVELQRTTFLLANGLLAGGVRAGDRIANMFYAGDLYGSFLLHVLSIMALPVPAVHIPIGGLTGVVAATDLVESCHATVLLTTATSLVKMAMYVSSKNKSISAVRRVLFGGEPLFPDQERLIREAFPRAKIRSSIYGTIEAGVLAMAAPGEDTQVHQAFTDSVHLEIVRIDGSGVTIEENDVSGILVATNTLRQLYPVIRYPTGDRAAWVDKGRGIFRLLGRVSQAVRVGPISIDMTDLRAIVAKSTKAPVQGVQAVISHQDGVDQLRCMVATALVEDGDTDAKAVESELYHQRPMFLQHVEMGLVAPLVVRFVPFEELQLASGSHKVLEIVDTRF